MNADTTEFNVKAESYLLILSSSSFLTLKIEWVNLKHFSNYPTKGVKIKL